MASRALKKAVASSSTPSIKETTVLTMGASTHARMVQILGLPPAVVDLLFSTTYTVGEGETQTTVPLLSIGRSVHVQEGFVYNTQEIQELVRVYDLMKGAYTGTGTEDDPVRYPYSSLPIDQTKVVSDEEAFMNFKAHIDRFVLDKERKSRQNLLVEDDSIYEAPVLTDLHREEILKVNLMNRKRVPVKGNCTKRGCGSDLIYQEEKFTRAGDEGGVWHNECAKCGHTWKA